MRLREYLDRHRPHHLLRYKVDRPDPIIYSILPLIPYIYAFLFHLIFLLQHFFFTMHHLIDPTPRVPNNHHHYQLNLLSFFAEFVRSIPFDLDPNELQTRVFLVLPVLLLRLEDEPTPQAELFLLQTPPI